MANPFKDAEKRKKVAPGGKNEPTAKIEETPIAPEKTVPTEKENPLAGKIEQKAVGKAHGFYLSPKAAENLERLAKQNRCSKSKALDTLLSDLYS